MNKNFILFINSIEDQPKITLFDVENFKKMLELIIPDRNQLSEQLLVEIEQLLTNLNIKKTDLAAIIGHVGPGSYTGVRIGITTANLLAFSLDVPIFPLEKANFSKDDCEKVKNKLKTSDHFILPILPVYKAPPFITKSRF